jgi:hypothetical protein
MAIPLESAFFGFGTQYESIVSPAAQDNQGSYS